MTTTIMKVLFLWVLGVVDGGNDGADADVGLLFLNQMIAHWWQMQSATIEKTDLPKNIENKTPRFTQLKCVSSRLAFVFAQSIEAIC